MYLPLPWLVVYVLDTSVPIFWNRKKAIIFLGECILYLSFLFGHTGADISFFDTDDPDFSRKISNFTMVVSLTGSHPCLTVFYDTLFSNTHL